MKLSRHLPILTALAALLALTIATPPPAQAADLYTKSVSVTSANATTTFTRPAYTVDLLNYGTATVYANLGGAAVSDGSDTVSMAIASCEAHHFEFPAGHSVAAVGLKTSASTATVQLTGSSIVPPTSQVFRHTITNFCANGGGVTTPTFTTGTFSSNVTVGGTLGVTGVATFTAQPIFSSTTASRIALTDASKGIVSNGAITTSAIVKSASSGASLSASSISDDGTNVTITEPILQTGTSVQGNTTVRTLTESAATTTVTLTVPSNSRVTGTLEYSVEADDGTDFQVRGGLLPFTAVNKAGTTTCTVATVTTATEVATLSSGTLANTWTCADGGSGALQLKANAVSSLTQTTLQVRYRVRGLAATTLVVTPS